MNLCILLLGMHLYSQYRKKLFYYNLRWLKTIKPDNLFKENKISILVIPTTLVPKAGEFLQVGGQYELHSHNLTY